MAKTQSRSSKRAPSAKRQRPAAPLFDLGPRVTDTLAPVSSQSAAATFEPMERPTVPDAPSSLHAHPPAKTTELEESATDLAFFASADEAVAKAHAEVLAEVVSIEAPVMRAAPTREQLRRRNTLQKAVSAIVGVAAVASLLAGVRFASARAGQTKSTNVAATSVAVTPLPSATVVLGVRPVATTVAEVAAPVVAEPVVAAEPKVDPDAAKALTKSALSALERGKYADAIAAATKSIAADASDANAYLYLGTALMETGKRAEAKAAFAACVETATRGPKAECRQFK